MPIKIVPKNDGMDEDQELDQFGGFGREAVEEAAKRPTYYASTQGQVGERERREAAVAGPLKKPAPVKKPEKRGILLPQFLKKLLIVNQLKLLKLKLKPC
jgi:hypothetical protein